MNVNHQKALDHKKNVSGRNVFFFSRMFYWKAVKNMKMLNNQVPKVLYVILKGECGTWKGCEIVFTNKYLKS